MNMDGHGLESEEGGWTMEDGGTKAIGVDVTNSASSDPPVVLEYRRAQRPAWSFRPANFMVVPFSLGTGTGASLVTTAATLIESRREAADATMLLGAATFIVLFLMTAALCFIVLGLRQLLDRRVLG